MKERLNKYHEAGQGVSRVFFRHDVLFKRAVEALRSRVGLSLCEALMQGVYRVRYLIFDIEGSTAV